MINIDELKKKIIYRSNYRGTKEMDILMNDFVRSIIDKLSFEQLKSLDEFVNMDDEIIISIKKKESNLKYDNKNFADIIKIFQNF